MSTNKVKTDQTGYQLNAKELTADLPFMLKGVATGLIDFVNSIPDEHTHKALISEVAPFVIRALPIFAELHQYINYPMLVTALKAWAAKQTFFTDIAAVQSVLAKAEALSGEAVAATAETAAAIPSK